MGKDRGPGDFLWHDMKMAVSKSTRGALALKFKTRAQRQSLRDRILT
ncbi:hypothetical protein D3OALGA1CA_3171 [Olavius algarvensis associated proteobacterium Delta 3]|nr:hypothetical protein D3OALGA1CA_3171 [Olavius algarvensis associated proteobacterium Delta 3]CAB5164928.1 hypothetical protein D3OALGB2SA_5681 [Olavius algarvensis associated proteobacterium Delta 3]